MVARCLIDVWHETIPVRLMNITNEPIQLNRGYPIGELQLVEEQVKDVGVVDVPVRMVRAEDSSGGSGAQTGMESTTDTALLEEKRQSSGQANEETVAMATIQQEADELPEYLRGLYQNCSANLSCAERGQLRCILNRPKDAFARNKLDLGCYNGIENEINTAYAAPVRQRVRPTPKGFEDEAKKCLEKQLEAGIVRPSSSAWASPTVLVRKANRSVRYCVDFRKVNDRTVKDAYPLPRINMCLDSLGNIKYFSTLDLQSGYWQIRVKESDIPKTAFITKYELFEYTKMLFGLCNAGSSFQRCMELIFRGLQWQTLLIYLDDIIILGRDINENLDRLDEALGCLQAAGLKLKPKKWFFKRRFCSSDTKSPHLASGQTQSWSSASWNGNDREIDGRCSSILGCASSTAGLSPSLVTRPLPSRNWRSNMSTSDGARPPKNPSSGWRMLYVPRQSSPSHWMMASSS